MSMSVHGTPAGTRFCTLGFGSFPFVGLGSSHFYFFVMWKTEISSVINKEVQENTKSTTKTKIEIKERGRWHRCC